MHAGLDYLGTPVAFGHEAGLSGFGHEAADGGAPRPPPPAAPDFAAAAAAAAAAAVTHHIPGAMSTGGSPIYSAGPAAPGAGTSAVPSAVPRAVPNAVPSTVLSAAPHATPYVATPLFSAVSSAAPSAAPSVAPAVASGAALSAVSSAMPSAAWPVRLHGHVRGASSDVYGAAALFRAIDANGDGRISCAEWHAAFEQERLVLEPSTGFHGLPRPSTDLPRPSIAGAPRERGAAAARAGGSLHAAGGASLHLPVCDGTGRLAAGGGRLDDGPDFRLAVSGLRHVLVGRPALLAVADGSAAVGRAGEWQHVPLPA